MFAVCSFVASPKRSFCCNPLVTGFQPRFRLVLCSLACKPILNFLELDGRLSRSRAVKRWRKRSLARTLRSASVYSNFRTGRRLVDRRGTDKKYLRSGELSVTKPMLTKSVFNVSLPRVLIAKVVESISEQIRGSDETNSLGDGDSSVAQCIGVGRRQKEQKRSQGSEMSATGARLTISCSSLCSTLLISTFLSHDPKQLLASLQRRQSTGHSESERFTRHFKL